LPVSCIFTLNNKATSTLVCSGYGTLEAYSGQLQGRDNPQEVAKPDIGPVPQGIYYLVDRRSGGRLGWLWDSLSSSGVFSSDHEKWFALWHPRTGDSTIVNGVRRGEFRLHPEGPRRLSKGCITVVNVAEFELLQRFIRRTPPQVHVPGTTLKAYGTVEVR
jgi:hypothetical protein